jgi:hypothetical protein
MLPRPLFLHDFIVHMKVQRIMSENPKVAGTGN